MKNRFEEFLALHHQPAPLLIGNVWNAQSAKIFEQQNFKAIATSSAAVAETLGYADGEEMSIEEYLFIIKNIAAAVSIPFSVDIEFGYGDTPEEIVSVIRRLHETGVAGINIEDSIVVNGNRSILDAKVFAEKLERITSLLDVELFINVRTDSFLLGIPNALDDAISRIDLYQHTGVHGLFLPCIAKVADIEKVTAHSLLPVNVMCIPGLPDFKHLQKAGVKRISMGPFLHKNIYQKMNDLAGEIVTTGSFEHLF
ncbi:isocitrate lyase/phosphoenolpyruvate mutase family protein [Chitinophaga oryziterrae]|uniref:Isocitrate lyase/phosphoenolpyruvate mutase family protein n=1 Tax=Chitinophaga oryziterrae TaxID=1031224 RepID=A0A6N8JKI1_9BACT|nr:isocitrate lyase/phosphoenolpyruvate mutase family protein [Chitinophaga oryziterrae]MVT44889.1 isocitrate lyase/phosphoenolpyruvate mutase family protein [Chitinophaga oryziterrae]